MPRLSLWKEGAHSNNYRFIDKKIREQFTVGGTTINVHKYLGAKDSQTAAPGSDATQPNYDVFSETNIQDLLFLENRDRKYDTSVFALRAVYNVNDIDFDLSQFGLFLQNDTLFIVFHLNDMIDLLGRKIMSGDVLEIMHMRDWNPLDSSQTIVLKKYYVVQDAARASEGYSATWWPHLWRVKAIPMPAGQEYDDILNQDSGQGDGTTLKDVLSTYNKEIEINDAIINQALAEVPEAGYDTNNLYTLPTNPDGSSRGDLWTTADTTAVLADSTLWSTDKDAISPLRSGYRGYLLGDGKAPNGHNVTMGVIFPENPEEGQFVLRIDYFPNRLFRWNGRKWIKVEDDVRTPQIPHFSKNQKSSFVNNTVSTTLSDGTFLPQRQTLSQALAPKADN